MSGQAGLSHAQQEEGRQLIDLTLNIRLLKMFGMLGLEREPGWDQYLHNAYSTTCYVLMVLSIVANVCGMVRDWGDFDAVVNNGCSTFCMIFITVRGIYFACRRRAMLQLISRLTEFEAYILPDEEGIVAGASHAARVLTISFYSFVLLIWVAFVVTPTFADGYSHGEVRHHPLMAAYFFDHKESPNYELVYVLQSASLLFFVPTVCGFDTTAVAILLHISAQFRVLLAVLGGVRWSRHDLHGEDGPRRAAMGGDPGAHRTLVRCIQHHLDLIKYVKEYDEMYHHIMLCQFLYSTVIIALSGFMIIEGSTFGIKLKFFLLGTSLLFEMFLFCKCGDDILQLSQQLGDAAFYCGWLDGDSAAKWSVRMIIMRAQRPCNITAYHVKVLCLETFASLMNGSYTYMALLRQFKKDN